MDALAELAAEWREEAEVLERHGCERAADQLRQRARDVERRVRDYWNEGLTVEEAAEESGYRRSTLREMVRDGRIPDLRPDGSQATIRVRRADLPKKPPAPARGRAPRRPRAAPQREQSAAERLAERAGSG